MKCPHCHKDIRPTDHFCPHCGYDLRRNPPRSTTILGRMMKGYLVIMLLTIALPMAIVFYSQFFTGKSITSNFQQSKLYELGELKKLSAAAKRRKNRKNPEAVSFFEKSLAIWVELC